MLIMKASPTMDAVFRKTIKVMGQNVQWNGTIAFNNNTLILPGSLKSLLFSFDNKKIIGTVIEEKLDGEVRTMPEVRLMENTINVVLYVFGKWNLIKGLTVEQSYSEINSIFNSILEEINVKVDANATSCRFYKDEIRITYEEVIELILEYLQPEELEEDEEVDNKEKSQAGVDVKLENQQKIGLWHKIIWKSLDTNFIKEIVSPEMRKKSRMGKHFYLTGYKCPVCGENLHMTVYPDGSEEVIETDLGRVIVSRVYTCPECVSFYTARPDCVLIDGLAFKMDFEDDEVAYRDYLDVISENGDRTFNNNLNRFESAQEASPDDTKVLNDVNDTLNMVLSDARKASDDELLDVSERMDSGFYKDAIAKKVEKCVHKELKNRGIKVDGSKRKGKISRNKINDVNKAKNKKEINVALEAVPDEDDKKIVTPALEQVKKHSQEGFEKEISKMSYEDLTKVSKELERQIKIGLEGGGDTKTLKELKTFKEKADKQIATKQLLEVKNILIDAQKSNYAGVKDAYGKVQKMELPKETKEVALKTLRDWMRQKGAKELEIISMSIPTNLSRKQYKKVREKLQEYADIDNKQYIEKLDRNRDEIEQKEIADYIKKNNKRPRDRRALLSLSEEIKKLDYEERNKIPAADELREVVAKMDEREIEKICPDVLDLDFEDALNAYSRIKHGDFLPEIKEDVLGRILRRLEGIKKDECRNLVKKLIRDTGYKEGEINGVYVYELQRMWGRECNDVDAIIFHNAIFCFSQLEAFEYPLMVYDSTKKGTGKKGFLLTPDVLHFGVGMEMGQIKVKDIKRLYVDGGLFSKGIYANTTNGTYKISSGIKGNKTALEGYLNRLNRFIGYLNEKPMSRNVEYLIREKHEIKCCLRCGYIYDEGNICPKCGSKSNV